MKIAYIIDGIFDFNKPNSVAKKVILQVTHWCELGHEVFIYSSQSGNRFYFNLLSENKFGDGYNDSDSAFFKLLKYWKLTSKLLDDVTVSYTHLTLPTNREV